MEENGNLDFEGMMDEMSARLEDILEGMLVDQVEGAVTCAVSESVNASLSGFEFVLKDGTVVRPRQSLRLLSPDKTKLLPCYGGLRVDGTSLIVQTGPMSWECIACYVSKEEAVSALEKVKNAIFSDAVILEL